MPCAITNNGTCSHWQMKSRKDFGGSDAKPWSIVSGYEVPDYQPERVRCSTGRATPLEPGLRKRLGLGWCSYLLIRMTWPSSTLHSRNHWHKLQVCTMAAAVLDLAWAAGLNFSVFMSLKDSLNKGIKYQFQILKYNLHPVWKIIRGSQSSNWIERTVSGNYIRETLGRGPKSKGENQDSLKSGFQRTEQGPKVCSAIELIYPLFIFCLLPKKDLRWLIIKTWRYMDGWERDQKPTEKEARGWDS